MNKIILLLMSLVFVVQKSPSLDEFILMDKTNEIMFVEDVFDCLHFTETFVKNAQNYGFDARPVYAGLERNGGLIHHMFVEVHTEDGVFWVEPQLDLYYRVASTGEPLCLLDGRCVTQKLVYVIVK